MQSTSHTEPIVHSETRLTNILVKVCKQISGRFTYLKLVLIGTECVPVNKFLKVSLMTRIYNNENTMLKLYNTSNIDEVLIRIKCNI